MGSAILIPGQTTLQNVVQTAYQRSDLVNTGNPTQDEIEQYANASYQELYGILVQAYGDNYKIKLPVFSFVTNGNQDLYPLPIDCFKVMLVEWQQQPGNPSQNVTLQRFNFQEKNRWSNTALLPTFGGYAPLYDVVENQLYLVPRANQGMTIALWYIPRPSLLMESGEITFTSVAAGNQVVIQSLGQPWGQSGPNAVSPAIAQTTVLGQVTFAAVASGASGSQFNVGANDTVTAANFVTTFNANVVLNPTFIASSSGPVVTIAAVNPNRPYTLQCSGYSLAPFPNTMSFWPDDNWSNLIDGVNGWEEYIVVDTCIKVLGKLDRDPSLFERQKQGLLARIRAESRNRDAGSPMTVVDVRRSGGGFGNGGWGT